VVRSLRAELSRSARDDFLQPFCKRQTVHTYTRQWRRGMLMSSDRMALSLLRSEPTRIRKCVGPGHDGVECGIVEPDVRKSLKDILTPTEG